MIVIMFNQLSRMIVSFYGKEYTSENTEDMSFEYNVDVIESEGAKAPGAVTYTVKINGNELWSSIETPFRMKLDDTTVYVFRQ